MDTVQILVKRDDLTTVEVVKEPDVALNDGEVRIMVEKIGLSANNISYAVTGDALGYWAHFSPNADWGSIPVWGFAEVTESRCADIEQGEKIFGFLPMSSSAVVTPTNVSDVCFTDSTGQRSALHPWYTRLYRCSSDPVYSESSQEVQPTLWALFMTGWMMVDQLEGEVDRIIVSSASSKTALSLGWAAKARGIEVVGLTSSANHEFVDSLQVYSSVVTYDQLEQAVSNANTAYVDIAGNGKVTSDVHVVLGDRLIDSILIGSTHRAPSTEPLPMPGPTPRFFFIPDVAETKANELGFEAYHQQFASAWLEFAEWSLSWLEFENGVGAESIEAGYLANFQGGNPPQSAMVYCWR